MQSNVCSTTLNDVSDALAYDRPKFKVIEGGLNRPVARRRDVACVFVIALVSLVVFAGTWLYTDLSTEARLQSAFDASSYETITVVSGDSLWSIAEAHPVSGCTTQQVANHICESNNLESSYLATGIKLVVPKAGK